MDREVRWTEAAWHDLEQIADYIASDSPHYAAATVTELYEAALSLSQFAARGRAVPELADSSVREIFIKSYRLIYQITRETIYILAIVHGARDLPNVWRQDERGV